MKVHGEIQYGSGNNSIHSDICPPGCESDNIDQEYRDFLHTCLDEWLDKSNGTGMFYIKNQDEVISWQIPSYRA
jgi:hypothetical protein